jgi:hypothetical protein
MMDVGVVDLVEDHAAMSTEVIDLTDVGIAPLEPSSSSSSSSAPKPDDVPEVSKSNNTNETAAPAQAKDDIYIYKPDYSNMTEDERLLAPVVTKSTSIAFWQASLGLAQITKMRGNMWRKVGFTVNTTNFLYPEEALYMFEKGSLAITKSSTGIDFMNKREVYEAVLKVIPIPCYLSYCRLKVMISFYLDEFYVWLEVICPFLFVCTEPGLRGVQTQENHSMLKLRTTTAR